MINWEHVVWVITFPYLWCLGVWIVYLFARFGVIQFRNRYHPPFGLTKPICYILCVLIIALIGSFIWVGTGTEWDEANDEPVAVADTAAKTKYRRELALELGFTVVFPALYGVYQGFRATPKELLDVRLHSGGGSGLD
jgi:hypothetical protein